MMKKIKHVFGLLLVAMCLGLTVPVMAEEQVKSDTSTKSGAEEIAAVTTTGGSDCYTATAVNLNTTVKGQLTYKEKYFKFTLPSSGYVELELFYDYSPSGWLDVEMRTSSSDSSDYLWVESYALKEPTDYKSAKVGLSAGTYYVLISGDEEVDYSFKVNYTQTAYCETEFNDDAYNADEISLNQTYVGSNASHKDGHEDYYKLNVSSAGTLKVKFNPTYAERSSSFWYVKVIQADSNGYLGDTVGYMSCDTNVTSNSMKVSLGKGIYYLEIDGGLDDTNYTFKVSPYISTPKLTSVSNIKTKKIKVKWKKNTSCSGYQIQYSASSKFSSKKTVKVKKKSTTSCTISKLKKNKKYYVRIRSYKKVSGKTYYSAWSSAKSVKIKK